MTEPFPPPIYTQTDPPSSLPTRRDPQILIVPTGNAVNFQKGFLGADGEPAAIEGELQIKGWEGDQWAKITISLRTVETVDNLEVELGASEVVLFSLSHESAMSSYSSFPFAIPLTPDVPQSIQTPWSSLSHLLTATLLPLDATFSPITRTLVVHTKRYTSHSRNLLASPETFSIEHPSKVDVEIPRPIFRIGESIPVYITIPPPPREIVIEQGLRLRNVRVELVQRVTINRDVNSAATTLRSSGDLCESTSIPNFSLSRSPDSSNSPVHPASDTVHSKMIAHSGASCRFHSSRPVRLRFVLHQAGGSPPDLPVDLPDGELVSRDSDSECPSITQYTLFHTVTFRLIVNVAYLDIITRRERISVVSIPLSIIAPPAPRPQLPLSYDAYSYKKQELPPVMTIRADDEDHLVPHYSQGIAGPSALPPPPFEEHDAPPPFWYNDRPTSISGRLPSFLESESQMLLSDLPPQHIDPAITGEGSEFGFFSSEQFDGHSEPLQQESLSSLHIATREADLSSLTSNMEGLGLVIDPDNSGTNASPPPPPAMDDPLDPPPCIDSEFRIPEVTLLPPLMSAPRSSAATLLSMTPDEYLTPTSTRQSHPTDGYDPPPYLNENVPRPPPYVD